MIAAYAAILKVNRFTMRAPSPSTAGRRSPTADCWAQLNIDAKNFGGRIYSSGGARVFLRNQSNAFAVCFDENANGSPRRQSDALWGTVRSAFLYREMGRIRKVIAL